MYSQKQCLIYCVLVPSSLWYQVLPPVAAVTVFCFVKKNCKFSLKAKFGFIYFGAFSFAVELLPTQWQGLHLLKEEEGYVCYRQEWQGFLVSALIYLIRGWGLIFQGKSVQIDFMFLPLANNKSWRRVCILLTTLTYLHQIKNFQILCGEKGAISYD